MAHVTPATLVDASMEGDVSAIGDLLAAGADIGTTDEEGWMPLMAAAATGHVEAAQLLIAAGADVNEQDQDGWPALCYAVDNHRGSVVAELISKGASCSLTTADGWTALHMACVEGDAEVFGLVFGAVLATAKQTLNWITPEVRRHAHCLLRARYPP